MKVLAKAVAILDYVSCALFVMACITLLFVVVSVLFEVVMRYFFNNPTTWVFLTSGLGLAVVTFLSVAWIQKREGHVRMDMAVNMMSIRGQALLGAVTYMLTTFALLVVTWYGGKCTWELFLVREMWGDQPFDLLRAPFLAVVPVGSFMLALQTLRRTLVCLQSWILKVEPEARTAIKPDVTLAVE